MLDRRLLIVTGKGGVGRSAVTAAIARLRAARGERVLALAVDRGAGLAAHLGLAELTHDPLGVGRGLHAAIVDPASSLEEYVRLRVGRAPLAAAARVFRVLAAVVPGVRDIVSVGKVAYEATRGDWDAVVVDAPPAGQIQSMLQAPRTIADLVPRGSVHEHAREVERVLARDDLTELVVVATPEELALTEAREVLATAEACATSSRRAIVANRVVPEPAFRDPPAEDGPRAAAARLHLDVRREQQRLLAQEDVALTLPLLFGAHRPIDTAAALVGFLERP